MFTLTIECDTDASSGDYGTYNDAVDAVIEAAEVDGLSVVLQPFTENHVAVSAVGSMQDSDGQVWFTFHISPAAW